MASRPAKTRVVLLPGLHGTAGLCEEFVALAPPQCELMVLSYPLDRALDYATLTHWICEELEQMPSPVLLVGESFSGPLAVFVAQRRPSRVLGVVLVASFIAPPRPPWLRYLPWRRIFSLAKAGHRLGLRVFGRLAPTSLMHAVFIELQRVGSDILALRLRQTLQVDAVSALEASNYPLLYLQAARDWVVPRSSLRRLLRVRAGVRVARFPSSHFLLQEVPEQAWLAIVTFIASLPPAI